MTWFRLYIRILTLLLLTFSLATGVFSDAFARGVNTSGSPSRVFSVDSVRIRHSDDSVQIVMRVNLPPDEISRNDVELLEVRLVHGGDSVSLPSIGVYGKRPYYTTIRSGIYLFQNPDRDIFLRWKDAQEQRSFFYARTVRKSAWMEGAHVRFVYSRYTCCGKLEDVQDWQQMEVRTLRPKEVHSRLVPEVLEKTGNMHVDFILDSIRIRPDYHDNRRELGKLDHDLDSLLRDKRVTIQGVTLHGYASPEGPYMHNVWLAKNRTEALRRYVAEHHNIDPAIIHTRYTPEDWEGLRRYVQASNLPHRMEILAVIDDTVSRPDPDVRLRYIRRQYVEDFADIFDNSLPFLRHTEYTIRYTYLHDRVEKVVVNESPLPSEPLMQETPIRPMPPLRPLFAVKTNLLLDALAWPNVEVEVPFGRRSRWSFMAEWGSPWYVWHHNSRAYEILNIGVELRRWLRKCDDIRPLLSGGFVGAYAAGGKYDIEWASSGDQGEYGSIGISAGYSWILGKCWNIELSGSVGFLLGPQRHYNGYEFNDEHLIWQHNDNLFYFGPTQLKVSIVWLIPRKWFVKE